MSQLALLTTPAPRLEVYIRTARHVYSGWKLWTSNGTGDGHAQITVQTQADLTYWISFVGVVGHPETTFITMASIRMNQTNCTRLFSAKEMHGLNQSNYSTSRKLLSSHCK